MVATLVNWVRAHPEFVVGTNEAGMRLGDDTRAADAAVWRRADTRRGDPGLRFVPPVLAVEVTGREEGSNSCGTRRAGTSASGCPSSGSCCRRCERWS